MLARLEEAYYTKANNVLSVRADIINYIPTLFDNVCLYRIHIILRTSDRLQNDVLKFILICKRLNFKISYDVTQYFVSELQPL